MLVFNGVPSCCGAQILHGFPMPNIAGVAEVDPKDLMWTGIERTDPWGYSFTYKQICEKLDKWHASQRKHVWNTGFISIYLTHLQRKAFKHIINKWGFKQKGAALNHLHHSKIYLYVREIPIPVEEK